MTNRTRTESRRVIPSSAYWPLDDTGTVAFTGTVPGVTSACALDQLTVQAVQGGVTSCVAPVATGACGAPSSALTAATTLASTIPNASATSPVTLTISMDVASGLSASANGLRLLIPLVLSEQRSSFGATLSYPKGVVIL